MEKGSPPIVKKSLFSWIISKNTWLQIALVIAAIFAVLANVFPLEMQKRIVNDAINLRKFDMLVFYCGLYLIAVITASILKYLINIL
jgi:ABC-type multidrug transport system fused ATPase/permease subunit